MQRFFHHRENAIVAAMQVGDRLFRLVEQVVVSVVHFVVDGDNGVFDDLHVAVP
ncbi:hypothetical protein D3C85_1606530 [compost metagenome]